MFARFFVLLSLLLTADSTLPNGIRLSDFASTGERFQVTVGYQAGIRNENGSSGLASIVSHFFAATPAARALALAAYGAGGEIEFLNELDRTAIRISVPGWAVPTILDQLPLLIAATPDHDPELIDRARNAVLSLASERSGTFRSKVEDEVRIGLLGSHPYHHPADGWKTDVQQISNDDVVRFFNDNYGTDRAFITTTSALPEESRRRLSAITQRNSRRGLAEASADD